MLARRRARPVQPVPSAGVAVLTREEALSDTRDLFDGLASAHPNLYFARPPEAVERDVRAAEARFGDRVTRTQLFRALAPIVASLRDGHTYLDPLTADYVRYRNRHGVLFPLELDCAGDEPVVVADYERDARAMPGAALVSLGGLPVWSAIGRVARYEPGSDAERRYEACRDLRPLFFADGVHEPYRIAVRERGSPVATAWNARGVPVSAIRAWYDTAAGARYADARRLGFAACGAIAILTLSGFDDDTATRAFVDDALRRMRARRTRALLIDVRENHGGSFEAAAFLIDRLSERPYRLVSRWTTKVSAFVRARMSDADYRNTYGDEAAAAPDGTLLEGSATATRPRTVPVRFRGSVFVLIGAGTFSSAATFAAAVQDARIGTILGSTSGGEGSYHGERFGFSLPVSGLAVAVSTKFFVRPNGDARVAPVVPDVRLRATAPLAPDAEIRSAVDVVRARSRLASSCRVPHGE